MSVSRSPTRERLSQQGVVIPALALPIPGHVDDETSGASTDNGSSAVDPGTNFGRLRKSKSRKSSASSSGSSSSSSADSALRAAADAFASLTKKEKMVLIARSHSVPAIASELVDGLQQREESRRSMSWPIRNRSLWEVVRKEMGPEKCDPTADGQDSIWSIRVVPPGKSDAMKAEQWKKPGKIGKAEKVNDDAWDSILSIVGQLPTGTDDKSKCDRISLFKRWAVGGRHEISLCDVESGLTCMLKGAALAREIAKPLHLAFSAVVQLAESDQGDSAIKFHEFRLLLVHIKLYFELYHMFSDTRDGEHDWHISFAAFKNHLPVLRKWGLSNIAAVESDARSAFSMLDIDGSGKLHFNTFAEWCVSNHPLAQPRNAGHDDLEHQSIQDASRKDNHKQTHPSPRGATLPSSVHVVASHGETKKQQPQARTQPRNRSRPPSKGIASQDAGQSLPKRVKTESTSPQTKKHQQQQLPMQQKPPTHQVCRKCGAALCFGIDKFCGECGSPRNDQQQSSQIKKQQPQQLHVQQQPPTQRVSSQQPLMQQLHQQLQQQQHMQVKLASSLQRFKERRDLLYNEVLQYDEEELLGAIDEGELLEMRSCMAPPQLVEKVLGNVQCILGREEDWESIQQSLESLPTFFGELQRFEPHSVTSAQLQRLRMRLHECHDAFNPTAMQDTSQACALLACWVNLVCWRMGEERWFRQDVDKLYPAGSQRGSYRHGADVHSGSSELSSHSAITQPSDAPRDHKVQSREGKARSTTPKRQGRQTTPKRGVSNGSTPSTKVLHKAVAEVRTKLQAATGNGHIPWAKIFRDSDRNNSGQIGFEAFRSKVRSNARIAPDLVSDEELRSLFQSFDKDHDGFVHYKAELLPWLLCSEGYPHAKK